jgi:hypothetical protein
VTLLALLVAAPAIVAATVDLAFVVASAMWWTHGGGDGPKRRLRRLRARFRAVRRGAPVSARMVTR